MDSFDWGEVKPDKKQLSYPGSQGLFQLFWYTGQKTQYYASDDVDGNSQYRKIGSSTLYNLPNLWNGDGVTIINKSVDLEYDDSHGDTGTNISLVADAVMPHAMKSIAGLYRLFTYAVAIDWPTFHHDNRRTGYTILKGDFNEDTSKSEFTFPGDTLKDYWDSPSIGDIDGDGKGELVVGTYNAFATNGRVYALEDSGEEKWSFEQSGLVTDTPVIVDFDGDGKKEVVFSSWWGSRIFSLLKIITGGVI